MDFSEACCEINYILENLNPIDKEKIPNKVIKFFKDNMSPFYKVNLDVRKPLAEQELKEETKAFLQLLNYKYFSNDKEKENFKEKLKQENTENLDNSNTITNEEIEIVENDKTMEMVVYKKNIFTRLIDKFKKIFCR